MKLHYYKPPDGTSNFGDELNQYIWDHYFPNFFDGDEATVFFGIGTILRAAKKQYPNSEIIVFGCGAYSYQQKMEPNFRVNFVRGPLTATALGLDKTMAITDPAILTPAIFPMETVAKKYKYAYIPHFSVANNAYKKVVESVGIKYIDPTNTVISILEDMKASEKIICEAMHGAIVADAYRIPWIPVSSFQSFNDFKWKDWAGSLSISLKVNRLHRLYDENGFKEFLKRKYFAYKLKKIKDFKPYLSEHEINGIAKERILKRIAEFKKAHSIG